MPLEFQTRPWGNWRVLDQGDGYKVKRIEVAPNSRLSYQTHARRSELWVVVSGVATCVIEGRIMLARAGECVEVGIGQAHRLCNDHDEELVIIEIQRGSYTGEDDIVRLEDDYGRASSRSAT